MGALLAVRQAAHTSLARNGLVILKILTQPRLSLSWIDPGSPMSDIFSVPCHRSSDCQTGFRHAMMIGEGGSHDEITIADI
jgi:hypothetical protein